MDTSQCTKECEREARCTTCGMWKAPRGRSVAPEIANGMCGWDCAGYTQEPQPGHLWRGELARIREAEQEND